MSPSTLYRLSGAALILGALLNIVTQLMQQFIDTPSTASRSSLKCAAQSKSNQQLNPRSSPNARSTLTRWRSKNIQT